MPPHPPFHPPNPNPNPNPPPPPPPGITRRPFTNLVQVHIVVPDTGELKRSYDMFATTLEMTDGAVTMGCLTGRPAAGLESGWLSTYVKFGATQPEENPENKAADLFLITNCSTSELTAVKAFVDDIAAARPVCLWNLELDTLRADLGLLAFPPKSIHFDFLSMFRPVFYIRQRDYSKTINVAPFLINYSGALFREYPGPWQVRTDTPRYL